MTTTNGYTGDDDLAVQATGTTTMRYALDTAGGLSERLGAGWAGNSAARRAAAART